MVRLSVNLNAVAQLRNRRALPWPSLARIGRIALESGASGLTVHPRPDERHIRYQDVEPLSALVREYPGREYNVEGYPNHRLLEIVVRFRPHQVTLVPDSDTQATSDHGWNFREQRNFLKPIVKTLKREGMRVSLFCDADVDMVHYAFETTADRIELYTGPYGMTYNSPEKAQHELDRLEEAACAARSCGLGVNAGHDLTLDNVPALVERIPFIDEISIGHCLTADALIYGMAGAVQRYCAVMRGHEFGKGGVS